MNDHLPPHVPDVVPEIAILGAVVRCACEDAFSKTQNAYSTTAHKFLRINLPGLYKKALAKIAAGYTWKHINCRKTDHQDCQKSRDSLKAKRALLPNPWTGKPPHLKAGRRNVSPGQVSPHDKGTPSSSRQHKPGLEAVGGG